MAQQHFKAFICDICSVEKLVPHGCQAMVHRVLLQREKVQAIESTDFKDLCDRCFERLVSVINNEIDQICEDCKINTSSQNESRSVLQCLVDQAQKLGL